MTYDKCFIFSSISQAFENISLVKSGLMTGQLVLIAKILVRVLFSILSQQHEFVRRSHLSTDL